MLRLTGATSILIGLVALAWPEPTLVITAYLFAAYLAATGLVQIAMAIGETAASTGRRALLGVLGAIAVVGGVLLFRSPLGSFTSVALLVGGWLFISGVLHLVTAMSISPAPNRPWTGASGVVGLLGGILVLLQPGISLLALTITFGAWLVLHGALLIAADVT